MTIDSLIPADVAQFILDKIDSIAQMDALLLLRNQPEEEWSIDRVAKRLYTTEQETEDVLMRLFKDGFLAVRSGEWPSCRFQPKSIFSLGG